MTSGPTGKFRDPVTDLAETLEFGSTIHDVIKVADWLEMRGKRMLRFCPACQVGEDHTEPALAIGNTTFQCYSCNMQGDALELVQAVLRISEVKAERWIKDKERQIDDKPDAMPRSLDDIFDDATIVDPPKLLQGFLDRCRELPEKLLKLLERDGVSPEVAGEMGLRYYSRTYQQIIDELDQIYGTPALLESGLIIDMEAQDDTAGHPDEALVYTGSKLAGMELVRGAFKSYEEADIPYLLIPFREEGKVVYIKARPLVDNKVLRARDLAPQLGTGPEIPSMYNVDCLATAHTVFLCRRELDALAAMSIGHHAVGFVSLSMFRRSWVELLRDKKVVHVIDPGRENDPRLDAFDRLFTSDGLEAPERMPIKKRECVTETIQRHYGAGSGLENRDHIDLRPD